MRKNGHPQKSYCQLTKIKIGGNVEMMLVEVMLVVLEVMEVVVVAVEVVLV